MHLIHRLSTQFCLLYGDLTLLDLLKYAGYFLLLLIVLKVIATSSKAMKVVNGHGHRLFDGQLSSPLEVYEALKVEIDKKAITGLAYSSINHREGGVLSANRVYMRIAYRDNTFDICAAPFGNENFFVSWWLGDTSFGLLDALSNVFRRNFQKRDKTLYEQDTEIVFKEMVLESVAEVMGKLMETKGMRKLEEPLWQTIK